MKPQAASQRRDSDGRFDLDFGANGTFSYDFVIGADGAWPKVRPFITDIKPRHGGISYTTLYIPHASERYPQLANLVGPGTCFILSGKNGLVTHRGVGGSICVHVSASCSDQSFSQYENNTHPEVVRDTLLNDPKLFQSWPLALQDLVRTALHNELTPTEPRALNMRPLYMLPIRHSWEPTPGVTIGDAAHLMMPCAGEGVNLAMRDALELSKALVAACNEPSFTEASEVLVAVFEREMFARAREAAQETWTNSKLEFGEDGARAMADLMASYGPPSEVRE